MTSLWLKDAGLQITWKKTEYVEFELGRFKAKDWIQYRIEVECKRKNYSSAWYTFTVGKTFALGEVKTVEFRQNNVVVEFSAVGPAMSL